MTPTQVPDFCVLWTPLLCVSASVQNCGPLKSFRNGWKERLGTGYYWENQARERERACDGNAIAEGGGGKGRRHNGMAQQEMAPTHLYCQLPCSTQVVVQRCSETLFPLPPLASLGLCIHLHKNEDVTTTWVKG